MSILLICWYLIGLTIVFAFGKWAYFDRGEDVTLGDFVGALFSAIAGPLMLVIFALIFTVIHIEEGGLKRVIIRGGG